MKNQYVKKVFEEVKKKNPNEPEFIQAVSEVFESIEPVINERPDYENDAILERLVEPERQIIFRVPWLNDQGRICVNRGFRIQFNSAIGPYKGGLRLHPSVYSGILKFLAFEQVFKNSLTTLPMGGAKGGADFDPKGKSDREIMRFCQSFMNELYSHIGKDLDVPAGDIGVGSREIGYLYGQYRKITGESTGALTGKGISFGGSLARTEATGYGLCYFTSQMLNANGKDFKEKKVVISGSGNVALYANQKATEFGATVIAMSDSCGYVYDKNGIDFEDMRQLKEEKRGRISEYVDSHPTAAYIEGCRGIWNIPCDIALPCATQNEIDVQSARALAKNGCFCVAEGANMPSTPEAIDVYFQNGMLFGPAKAANAGGVAVSGLEMSQDSMRYSWTFEKVDKRLREIMNSIFSSCETAAETYGMPGNYMAGANIASFLKVSEAMKAQGCV